MDRVALHAGLSAPELFSSNPVVVLLCVVRSGNHYSNLFIMQRTMQDIDGFSTIPVLFILVVVSLMLSCMTLAFLLLTLLKNRKLYHTHSEDQHPFVDELDLSDGPTLTAIEGTRRPDQM